MENVTQAVERGFRIAPILNDEYAIIHDASKVQLVVDSVRDLEDNETLASLYPNEYESSYIINFKAIEARSIDRILEAFQMTEDFHEDEHLTVIPWDEAKGMTFSHRVNVFTNSEDKRPMVGDTLTVATKLATTKTGEPVYGKYDINGELITEDTPLELKAQVIEVADYIIPKAKKARTFSSMVNTAKANNEAKQSSEERAQAVANQAKAEAEMQEA